MKRIVRRRKRKGRRLKMQGMRTRRWFRTRRLLSSQKKKTLSCRRKGEVRAAGTWLSQLLRMIHSCQDHLRWRLTHSNHPVVLWVDLHLLVVCLCTRQTMEWKTITTLVEICHLLYHRFPQTALMIQVPIKWWWEVVRTKIWCHSLYLSSPRSIRLESSKTYQRLSKITSRRSLASLEIKWLSNSMPLRNNWSSCSLKQRMPWVRKMLRKEIYSTYVKR